MFKTILNLDTLSLIGCGMSLVASLFNMPSQEQPSAATPSRVASIPTSTTLDQKEASPTLMLCSVALLICATTVVCAHQWVRSPGKKGRLHKEPVPDPPPPPQAPPGLGNVDPHDGEDENGNDGDGDGDGDPEDLDVDAEDDREGDGFAVGAAPAPEDPPPPAGGVEEGDYEGDFTNTPAIAVLALFLIRLVAEFQKRQRGANAPYTVKINDSLSPAVPAGQSLLGPRRFLRKLYLQLTLYPGLALVGALSLLLLPAAFGQQEIQEQDVLRVQVKQPEPIEDEAPAPPPPPVDIPQAEAPLAVPVPDPDAAQPTRLQVRFALFQHDAPNDREQAVRAQAVEVLKRATARRAVQPAREPIRAALFQHTAPTDQEQAARAQAVGILQRATARRAANPVEEDVQRLRRVRIQIVQRRVWGLLRELAVVRETGEGEV
ncbi:hypothetical protein B0H15DRAFT_868805 [Mycena belliarum]|uniref:Transmembrane protein n=1 Tax=Mycena belliarum TaxID=1033014 RepID=A0AAD6XIS8_9AGAR|nr:hypothetical protein B0H15DRAFT_868805 [Mycena belliae]